MLTHLKPKKKQITNALSKREMVAYAMKTNDIECGTQSDKGHQHVDFIYKLKLQCRVAYNVF